MKMKKLKTALALLLALCMVLSLGGVTAWAEDNDNAIITVIGTSDGDAPNVTYADEPISFDPNTGEGTFDGGNPAGITLNEDNSISLQGGYAGSTSGIYAKNSTVTQTKDANGHCYIDVGGTGITANNSTVTVDGNVSGGADGVDATNGSEVTVGGDVKGGQYGIIASESQVNADNVTATNGIGIHAVDGSTVTAGSVSGSNTGVSAFGEGTTVEVTGSVSGSNTGVYAGSGSEVTAGSVTSTNGTGVNASGGSTVTVGTTGEDGSFTGGNVSGTSGGINATGGTVKAGDVISSNGVGVTASNSGSGSTVTITVGSVTSGDDGIQASGSGTTVNAGSVSAVSHSVRASDHSTVNVDGTVSTEYGDGVNANYSTVTVGGNVTSEYGRGVVAGGEYSDVNITGNVSGADYGIRAFDGNVTVGGDVTATNGVGIFTSDDGSDIKVTGNVTGKNTGVSATDQRTTVNVTGNITSTSGTGIEVSGGSTVTAGNVEGATAGVKVDGGGKVKAKNVTATNGDGIKVEGPANVTIDGTLTVTGGTPILLGDTVTETEAGDINIKVWEIQGQAADGSVVSGGKDGAAEALLQNIDYVIKVAPDETSQSVFGGYQAGDTMNSGKQQIKVTVPENYTLKAAFATNGETVPITKGEDGSYYATIPTSGGIYLHAEIEQLPEPKPDDPKPQPKPQPKPEAMNFVISWVEEPYTGSGKVETASVTFDLNGGQTIRGGKGPIVKEVPVDTWLRLLEAPVKEGATFAGWKCSDPTVTETKPGYAFRVTKSVSFTALWE